MKRSNRLVLLIGVFLAVVAFVGIIIVTQPRQGPNGNTGTPTVLNTVKAAQDIRIGTPIREEMLETEELPITSRHTTAFADTSLVVGQIARRPITAGAQLTAEDFTVNSIVPEFQLEEGQRAMSVEYDLTNGVAKVIQPGDYVDIVASLDEIAFPVISIDPDTGEPTPVTGLNSTSSKLVLQGMQVLGVVDTGAAQPAEGEEGPAGPAAGSAFAILQVSPQQAEVIKNLQSNPLLNDASVKWPISLVMRPPCLDDQGEATVCALDATTGITLRTLVDEYDVLIPQLVETLIPGQPTP